MQVSSKITDFTALTTPDLAAIGSYLLGLGSVALGGIAFYGVYRWMYQVTDKRDILESTLEEHKGL
jgi:hypothetical protein